MVTGFGITLLVYMYILSSLERLPGSGWFQVLLWYMYIQYIRQLTIEASFNELTLTGGVGSGISGCKLT